MIGDEIDQAYRQGHRHGRREAEREYEYLRGQLASALAHNEMLIKQMGEAMWRVPSPLVPNPGLALDHIDGNPRNNSPDNLRVVDIRENRGRE